MTEFTVLPCAYADKIRNDLWQELQLGLANRNEIKAFAGSGHAWGAFSIYNNSGDATSATAEIIWNGFASRRLELIVVGGTNESSNGLDLDDNDKDTITELVDAVNGLNKGWFAVVRNGADRTVDYIKAEGPVYVLGQTKEYWFGGNVSATLGRLPQTVAIGDRPGKIGQYRDSLSTQASAFYDEPSIQAHTPEAYTETTLREEALGFEDWDYTDEEDYEGVAQSLTPPCPPHAALWNDMKLCLDLMVWFRTTPLQFTANDADQYSSDDENSLVSWNAARAAGFSNLLNDPGLMHEALGRGGEAFHVSGPPEEWECDYVNAWLKASKAVPLKLTDPPDIIDGYLTISHSAPASDYSTNLLVKVEINGTSVTSGATSIDGSDPADAWIHLDNINDATFYWDGASDTVSVVWQGTHTNDPGAAEWPEPPADGGAESWLQKLTYPVGRLYLKANYVVED